MISFDIFDTLITRKTCTPSGIFLIIQDLLCFDKEMSKYNFLCQNFSKLRINAEKDARRYAQEHNIAEITLEDIYKILQERTFVSVDIIDKIMQMEIQAELDNSYPILKNIALLHEHYNAGEKIVLISDMYLSENIIRRILSQWDDIFGKIPIYVSSEWRSTKHAGSLFFDVCKTEKEEFDTWIHYGDNRISDYLMPRMLGIDARLIQTEALFSWEQDLSNKLYLENNLTLQYFLGVAKSVRMENECSMEKRIGASIGGMLLYPYISWIIRNSLEQGIKRLYFIARDGYVLKIIADEIIKEKKLDLVTKYIYGSRKAWRTDGLSESDRDLVLEYMEQEVDFSDENYAFVDLHGSGYTIGCLADIISDKFKTCIKVFYYDLLSETVKSNCICTAFCSEHSGFSELFCRAPHGATTSYKREGERIVPQLAYADATYARLYDYIEGIKLFAKKVSEWEIEYNLEDVTLVETIVGYCKLSHCNEILEFIGNLSHDAGENVFEKEYAPPLSLKDIFMIYMWRTMESVSDFYKGSDLQYSLLRTTEKNLKWKVFFEKNYNVFLGKIVQLYKSRREIFVKSKFKKVIIYGAGTIGKRLHRHLLFHKNFKIIAWTDLNYEVYAYMNVVPLQEALIRNYDYVIVALANRNSYQDVNRILQKVGVPKEKIISYEEIQI